VPLRFAQSRPHLSLHLRIFFAIKMLLQGKTGF
jgi:hypothetical protein